MLFKQLLSFFACVLAAIRRLLLISSVYCPRNLIAAGTTIIIRARRGTSE